MLSLWGDGQDPGRASTSLQLIDNSSEKLEGRACASVIVNFKAGILAANPRRLERFKKKWGNQTPIRFPLRYWTRFQYGREVKSSENPLIDGQYTYGKVRARSAYYQVIELIQQSRPLSAKGQFFEASGDKM